MSAGLILDAVMCLSLVLVLGLFIGYYVGFYRGHSTAMASLEPRLKKMETDADWYIENYKSMSEQVRRIRQSADEWNERMKRNGVHFP